MDGRVSDPIPPAILTFARSIRETFGPGVKLYKGQRWPGGSGPDRPGVQQVPWSRS